ncbi:hypothetical protein PMIN03_000309 [Paraphaeosphaeria minitans]|uniref:Keratin-associated protein 5-4 n=1 Tax=Paraphaeosphaeria minitans TaxID=565426 RepID=A0A9P6G5U7_9PLEO|nr:keratin-associated protein 5-4 [Paraphaeosphaeria minitans]
MHLALVFIVSLSLSHALSTSESGDCGSAVGLHCSGSSFGPCCSQHGYCGSSSVYCGFGCQADFGSCSTSPFLEQEISPDGTCGGTNNFTCAGSGYGECCSQHGYCGNTTEYCENRCRGDGCHQCAPVGYPCTMDNSTQCCTQCCYFATGDVMDGQCCDM